MIRKKIQKTLIFSTCVFAGALIFLLIYLGINYFSENVHTVIPNSIYRSAQLNEQQLAYYSKKFHLQSMINLRGAWKNDHWYQVESQFVKNHHIHYVSIHLQAYALPTKQQLQLLVNTLNFLPKPLIFHCEGGADRTGLASMMSFILFKQSPTITELKHQVSWRYNVISPRSTGYQVLRNYLVWLKLHHYQQSKARFLEWVYSSSPMKPYYGWFLV